MYSLLREHAVPTAQACLMHSDTVAPCANAHVGKSWGPPPFVHDMSVQTRVGTALASSTFLSDRHRLPQFSSAYATH